ncbi:MAG TPA: MFS transporter, partial [Syntrophobacteraceae bacterium]|nr:MFS transporter [Syntrophobacteraceae bacterium]
MSQNTVGVSVPLVSGEAAEARAYARVTWRLMPVLFISYIVAYLDRVNVGFAKLQMMQDLGLSDAVYGLGAGIFFIGYFIFEVPSNIILHRVGARTWIARIMVFWGIVSASTMFVSTARGFYIVRFLLGVAEAGFFPGIILYLTYWYPSYWRGRMVALLIAANPVSGVIGGPASGWIMHSLAGAHGWAGWQWLFVLEALPAVIIGIFVFFYLDDGIRGAKWLSEDEKRILERNIEAEAQEKQRHSLREAFRSGMVWLMSFIYFCLLTGMYGVTFWMPTIIKATGVKSVLNVGLLTAIPFAAGMVCMILISRRSDRVQERRWHCAVPAAISCIALIFSAIYGKDTSVAVVLLSFAMAGSLAALPVFWILPTAILGGTAAAAGIAIVNSIGNLSGFLGNYLVGWLTTLTHSTNAGLYVLATAAFLGAALVIAF